MPEHDDELYVEADDCLEMARRREYLLERINVQQSLRVPAVDLRYEPGGYAAWNGVKGGGPRGSGWSSSSLPSRYCLVIKTPVGNVEVPIDRTFKQGIGRLTRKRRELIRRMMPTSVTLVVGHDAWYGKDQMLVSTEDLTRWLEEVKRHLSTDRNSSARKDKRDGNSGTSHFRTRVGRGLVSRAATPSRYRERGYISR